MAALTKDRKTPFYKGDVAQHPVEASQKIYNGSLVMTILASGGNAQPAADTANGIMLGVAMEQKDNSSGADGDLDVKVYRRGIFEFAASGLTQADIGKTVYASDDQTVALSTTNSVKVGTLAWFIDATTAAVEIDGAVAATL